MFDGKGIKKFNIDHHASKRTSLELVFKNRQSKKLPQRPTNFFFSRYVKKTFEAQKPGKIFAAHQLRHFRVSRFDCFNGKLRLLLPTDETNLTLIRSWESSSFEIKPHIIAFS